MVASNIKVYLRVRPAAKVSPGFQFTPGQGRVSFEVPKNTPEHEVNNQKTEYNFLFEGVLGMDSSQQDILDTIAKPVIDDVLNGINGTIFAYGQTGSGKTFTITGGASRYEDRGLIPRTISYIFDTFRRQQNQFRMYVSYLEIYNDQGYDLLRDDSAGKLEDLPKVILREDEDGNIHLKNLSVNIAATQEDALNLLFLGDTNRVVAETPMNDASTRSHCLFIVWIESTPPGSAVVRRSKLHLVDLAGSERIARTNVKGTLLKEATQINLSLHYLEQVIVALHAKSKGLANHVPYRNSMMTSVLRDSLGGNCKTTMIGCIAVEPSNIDESISTCRFASRVAQITNNAKVNEEMDPNLLIARLRREVAELKDEVNVKRGDAGCAASGLTEEDVEKCAALVRQYVSPNVNPEEPFVCGSIERLRCSFRLLRDFCLELGSAGSGGGTSSMDAARRAALEAEANMLRLEMAQRDQEISVLMQMLQKQKKQGFGEAGGRAFIESGSRSSAPTSLSTASISVSAAVPLPAAAAGSSQLVPTSAPVATSAPPSQASKPPMPPQQRRVPASSSQQQRERMKLPPGIEASDLLLDKQQAFAVFREISGPAEALESNKALLRERIESAKLLGDAANKVRGSINAAKTRLERLRTERAMTAADRGDDSGSGTTLEDGPEELAEVREIDRLRAVYQEHTSQLRQAKSDVDQIQHFFEQHRVRQQREFEAWFSKLRKETSLDAIDDDRKRELYERITCGGAATSGSPTSAGSTQPVFSANQGPLQSETTLTRSQIPPSSSFGSAKVEPSPQPQLPSVATAGAPCTGLAAQPVLADQPPWARAAQRPLEQTLASAIPATQPQNSRRQLQSVRSLGSTGDAQVDDDIAAYFAAVGSLVKRS